MRDDIVALCVGEGVDAHVGKAFEWLKCSAASGSDRAQYNAALALDPLHPPWGTPGATSAAESMVPKDAKRALALYRAAVAQGHGKAKVNLGILLYTGTGCTKDAVAAEALWREASADGVEQADFCLRNMEDKGRDTFPDYFDTGNGKS